MKTAQFAKRTINSTDPLLKNGGKKLGAGSFGAVHLFDNEYALKTFTEEAELVREESNYLKLGSHSNVISLISMTPEGLILERGSASLHSRLEGSKSPMSMKEKLKATRDILTGLASLEKTGTVHRDLKSENILLMPDGSYKIADLGSMYSTSFDGAKKPGSIAGVSAYALPPEFEEEEEALLPSSDVWALGIVCYQMLSGERHPFKLDSITMCISALVKGSEYYVNDLDSQFYSAVERLKPADSASHEEKMLYRVMCKCLTANVKERPSAANLLVELHKSGAIEARPRTSIVRALATKSGAAWPPARPTKPLPRRPLSRASATPSPSFLTPETYSKKPSAKRTLSRYSVASGSSEEFRPSVTPSSQASTFNIFDDRSPPSSAYSTPSPKVALAEKTKMRSRTSIKKLRAARIARAAAVSPPTLVEETAKAPARARRPSKAVEAAKAGARRRKKRLQALKAPSFTPI
ncbi:MAG: protein kinase [Rhabdochlamydiaceae bacterium]|nr:protein kinase [Candidatus Amphrikana amoebophyrae]